MILFREIQSQLRELIAANSFFSGVQIIKDQGLSEDQIEAKLREAGAVVLVPLPLGGTRHSGAMNLVKLSTLLLVRVLVNPATNPAQANIDPMQAVENVIKSVLAYEPGPAEDGFDLAPESFDLAGLGDGVLAYNVRFTKQTVIPLATT